MANSVGRHAAAIYRKMFFEQVRDRRETENERAREREKREHPLEESQKMVDARLHYALLSMRAAAGAYTTIASPSDVGTEYTSATPPLPAAPAS